MHQLQTCLACLVAVSGALYLDGQGREALEQGSLLPCCASGLRSTAPASRRVQASWLQADFVGATKHIEEGHLRVSFGASRSSANPNLFGGKCRMHAKAATPHLAAVRLGYFAEHQGAGSEVGELLSDIKNLC